MQTTTLTIPNDLLDKLGSLLYTAWSESYDTIKRVKAETTNGESDWLHFHKLRLNHATKAEAELKTWLQTLTPHLPIVKAVNESRV